MDVEVEVSSRPKLLLVDDRPENLMVLVRLLQELDVELFKTTSGFDALALTLEHDFFAAIVDVQMPEMDGYELVELLRGNESTATLPVIFVSAIYSDEYYHRKAYDAGAVDFLSKPFVPEVLLSKVKVFLNLYRQRHQLEELVGQLNSANRELSLFTTQLRLSAHVSHRITSILDAESLLSQVVDLICRESHYYFVGVWLILSESHACQLAASSCEDEAARLPGQPQLPVNAERSLIAHVCRTGEPYVAPDVTADPHYLYHENLPRTASELVLPLKIGAEILGALDIQSEQRGDFSPEAITALQILADQLAIAIRNARLYAAVVDFNAELEDRVRARTAELEKAYRQLEMLDRNKSKFIQVVSHELRTPLTLIKGFSQILLRNEHLKENKTCVQQVEGIVSGADRMHEIVNSMIDMARIDNHTLELLLETVDLCDLLVRLRKNLSDVLQERRLTLELALPLDFPQIQADPDALSKLFANLLYNAVKYTPDGGRITISGRVLTLDAVPEGIPFAEIVVSDTGIGIDPSVQELIFTKFYQTGSIALHSSGKTKFKGGGAGLGLAIAQGIAEAHGGKIWVESTGCDEEICPGSHFHVVLPLNPAPVAGPVGEETPDASPVGTGD